MNAAIVVKGKRDEARARALWVRFDRRVASFERKFVAKQRPLFKRQRDEVMALFWKGSVKSTGDVYAIDWTEWEDQFADEMESTFLNVMTTSGEAAIASMGFSFDVKNPRVRDYLGYRTDKYAVDVNQTTSRNIASVMRAGFDEGASIREIAAGIEGVFEDAIGYRSELIARTEMVGSANWGTFEAYRQAHVPRKRWLTAMDGRERAWHRDANRQLRQLQQPFEVNGELLMHPGDPNGSGNNVCNCRCTMIPEVDI